MSNKNGKLEGVVYAFSSFVVLDYVADTDLH
jgi:hypothetical protein